MRNTLCVKQTKKKQNQPYLIYNNLIPISCHLLLNKFEILCVKSLFKKEINATTQNIRFSIVFIFIFCIFLYLVRHTNVTNSLNNSQQKSLKVNTTTTIRSMINAVTTTVYYYFNI